MLIYPGRIPKFNRDLKRAVPRTHLKVPRSGDYGNRYMIVLPANGWRSQPRRRVERRLRKSDTLSQVRYVRLAPEVTHTQAISDKSVARSGLIL